MDVSAVEITQRLLSRGSVRNNFYMAHTEFLDLDSPPPWGVIQGLGDRLHVLGCPEDIWMTQRQYDHLLRTVPRLQATWVETARHAYCTSLGQCKAVTDVIVGILEDEEDRHYAEGKGGAKVGEALAEVNPSEWSISVSVVETSVSKM